MPLIFDKSKIGWEFPGSVFEPALNISITLSNFEQFG